MATKAKATQQVKFEVGQLVEFNDRFGRVSKIAKNGAVYVIVLGETTVLNETQEELRVKKADLRLVDDCDHVKACARHNIAAKVSDCRAQVETATFTLAPEYIPSLGCLNLLDWEGSTSDKALKKDWGIDLPALATEYTGKAKQSNQADLHLAPVAPQGVDKIESGHEVEKEVRDYLPQVLTGEQGIEESASEASEAPVSQDVPPVMEEPEQSTKPAEPVQSAFSLESAVDSVALADATYALRELTFSVTRHSILTAFIDVALNKDIPGYHHKVASNIKNLMEAAFDPVNDAVGYDRIKTWMWAALELVVKHKARVAKMLNQPIEAAPIKIDRVTKLGMWLDSMMSREGSSVNDLTAAYDSCYMYDAIGKKVEACTFVVVEVIQSMDSDSVKILPVACAHVYHPEYVTAQSAIKMRQQFIHHYRPIEPDLHLYCGIVPVYKTGRPMQAAIEDTLASVIGSLK